MKTPGGNQQDSNSPTEKTLIQLDDLRLNLVHPDTEVRLQAVRDMVSLQDPRFLEELAEIAKNETDVQIRFEINKGISQLKQGKKSSTPAEANSNLKKVEDSLMSSDLEQVNKAFRYIIQYRLRQFLPGMQKVAFEQQSSYQKGLIIRFMLTLGGDVYFQEICSYLDDPDPRVISTAIEALEQIGNTKALAYVAQFTVHENNRVQATAMKAIYNLGDQSALLLFEKMVNSEHTAYRNSAAYALKEMKLPASIPLLRILLNDEAEMVVAKAKEGLKALADAGNNDALLVLNGQNTIPPNEKADYPKTTDDKMNWIREQLDKRESRTKGRFVEAIHAETDDKVVASLVTALARLGDVSCKEDLLPYLQHRNDRVRANAVEALGPMLEETEKHLLLTGFDDLNNRVIGNTILALFRFFPTDSLKAIQQLAESPNRNEQLTAVYCIGATACEEYFTLSEYLIESTYTEVREKMLSVLEDLSQDSSVALRILRQSKLRMAMFQPQEERESRSEQKSEHKIEIKVESKQENKTETRSEPKLVEKVQPQIQSLKRVAEIKNREKEWDFPSIAGYLFVISFCALVIGTRLLVQQDVTYFNLITPLKYFLLAGLPGFLKIFHYLICFVLFPAALIYFLWRNKEALLEEKFLFGFSIGLFLFAYIPTLNLLTVTSGQIFNVLGYYTSQYYFEDYSGSSRLSLLFFNFPWLFLPMVVEGFFVISSKIGKGMLGFFAILLGSGMLWMFILNSDSYLQLETRNWEGQEKYYLSQKEQILGLDRAARIRLLSVEAKGNQNDSAALLKELETLRRERDGYKNYLEDLDLKLKEIRSRFNPQG